MLTLGEVTTGAPDIRELFEDETVYENVITPLLGAVEADYLTIRNKPFDVVDGEPILPDGAKSVLLDMLRFRVATNPTIAIDSETSTLLGDGVAYSRNLITGYPAAIVGRIKRFIGAK